MICRTIAVGPGMLAIVCGPRQRQQKCGTPGCGRPCTVLCDYAVVRKGKAGTCSAKMCDVCRKRLEGGRDLCPPHAKLAARPNQVGAVGKAPAVGDRRIHIATGLLLGVLETRAVDGVQFVTYATLPADGKLRGGFEAGPFTVPLSKWIEKTREP